MPAFPAILIGLLVSPSTWVLVLTLFLYSPASSAAAGGRYVFAWLLLVGVVLHALRELSKDLPWLGRASPPPGLHCTPHEWNTEFVGKPLFATQLLCLTVIRGATVFLLIAWLARS
jgi:hypothetical protein